MPIRQDDRGHPGQKQNQGVALVPEAGRGFISDGNEGLCILRSLRFSPIKEMPCASALHNLLKRCSPLEARLDVACLEMLRDCNRDRCKLHPKPSDLGPRNEVENSGCAAGWGGRVVAAITLALLRRPHPLEISSKDLRYRERSVAELLSEHLLDLNTASPDDFLGLGLDSLTVNQIVENRPYRNKLDLLSRMVMPESSYHQIRHQVGVAEATEPIRVGS